MKTIRISAICAFAPTSYRLVEAFADSHRIDEIIASPVRQARATLHKISG